MTPIQVLALGGLTVGWLAIAFPLAMRTRNESVAGQVNGFHQAMAVLEPHLKGSTVSSHAMPARTPASLLLRRTLLAAVGACAVTLSAAVAWQGAFVLLAGITTLGTVAFVGVLRRRKVERDRAAAVITSMREHAGLPSPQAQRDVRPRAVGADAWYEEPTGWYDEQYQSAWRESRHDFRPSSDVRVLESGQRLAAHAGFDVLD